MKAAVGYPSGVHMFPFESRIKRMSIVVPNGKGGTRIYTKGAAEKVVTLCDKMLKSDGSIVKMTKESFVEVNSHINDFADLSLRNISLASGTL